MINCAKLKLDRKALAEALGLAPGSEILAATTLDNSLVIFIQHPDLPPRDERGATPEVTLDDLRALGVKDDSSPKENAARGA